MVMHAHIFTLVFCISHSLASYRGEESNDSMLLRIARRHVQIVDEHHACEVFSVYLDLWFLDLEWFIRIGVLEL